MLFKEVSNPETLGMINKDYRDEVAPILYSRGATHVTGGVYVNNLGGVSAVRALIGPGVKQDFNEKYFQTVDANQITFNLPSWQNNSKYMHEKLVNAFHNANEIDFFFAYVPHPDAHMSLWTNWFYGKTKVVDVTKEFDGERSLYKAKLQKI